jgi:hypothetical protein
MPSYVNFFLDENLEANTQAIASLQLVSKVAEVKERN